MSRRILFAEHERQSFLVLFEILHLLRDPNHVHLIPNSCYHERFIDRSNNIYFELYIVYP